MKPINPYLGASPLRVSRIPSIDAEGKSWDSVIFQQSKAMLDFDLNVMQRILQENIAQLSRTLLTSGFTSSTSLTVSGTNVYLADSRVNSLGTIARVFDPSGTGGQVTIPINNASLSSLYSRIFLWLEIWFQEIVPTVTTEPFDGSSALENKSSVVPYSGGVQNSTTLTNELYDSTYGSETTRRIQVRWRIRQTEGIDLTPAIVEASSISFGTYTGPSISGTLIIPKPTGLTGSIVSASSTTQMTGVTTTNLYPGMLLTKTSGTPGVFCTGTTTVASIDAPSASNAGIITITSSNTASMVAGLLTFSATAFTHGTVFTTGQTITSSIFTTPITISGSPTTVTASGLDLYVSYPITSTILVNTNTNRPVIASAVNVGSLGTAPDSYFYKITAVDSNLVTPTESVTSVISPQIQGGLLSALVVGSTGTLAASRFNKITWATIPAALKYNIYRTVVATSTVANSNFATAQLVDTITLSAANSLTVATGLTGTTGTVTTLSSSTSVTGDATAYNYNVTLITTTNLRPGMILTSASSPYTGGTHTILKIVTAGSSSNGTINVTSTATPLASTAYTGWTASLPATPQYFDANTSYTAAAMTQPATRTTTGVYGTGIAPFETPSGGAADTRVFAQGGRVEVSFTATTVSSSANLVISANTLSSGGYLQVGQRITGPNIPDGTTIASITTAYVVATGGTYVLSAAATASGTNKYYAWFTSSKTFRRANQLTDFAKFYDPFVYVAGDGNSADAGTLNTVDGRVYAHPLGYYNYNSGTAQFTDARSVVSAINSGTATFNSDITTTNLTSAIILKISAATSSAGLSISGGNASDIDLTLTAKGAGVIAAGSNLRVPSTTSAAAPPYSFTGQTSTGIYYVNNPGGSSQVGISGDGSNIVLFGNPVTTFASALTSIGIVTGTAHASTGTAVGGSGIGSGRYLGTTANANPTGGTYISGDYVLDSYGYVRVYNGSSWILAGTNVGDVHTWTALQTFTTSITINSSSAGSYGLNLATGTGTFTIGTAANWAQTISGVKFLPQTIAASVTGTTLLNAANLEIGGIPTKSGTAGFLTLTNSYGIKLNTSSTTAINAYGVYIDAPTGGTTNYALYVASGTSTFASATVSNSTTTGAVVITGGLGVGGTVTATAFSGSFSGAHNGTVGAGTPTAGAFTTISASGLITATGGLSGAVNGTVGAGTPTTGAFTTISASGLITATGGLSGAHNGTVGATTPSTGAFTTLTANGAVTISPTAASPSTNVTSGALVISNGGLGVSGAVWAGGFNGAIGAGTPSTGAFTTISASGLITATGGVSGALNGTVGATTASTGAFTTISASGTVAGTIAPKVFLPAQAFNLPPTSYPAFLQRDTGTTKYELQYSGTLDQVAHTTIVVPSSYSGGNITIKLYWYTATADQAISWQVLAASTGNGGDPNPATFSLATITSSTNTAAKLKLETYSWISSNAVSLPSAGQILYLSLKRLGSTDVSSETINFHSMIIEF